MAIDRTGINSIDVGAHDITYSGNEGPKSPGQKEMMAFDDTPRLELQPLELLLNEFRQDNNGRDPTSIDDLRRFFYNKYGPEGIAQVEKAVQQAEQQAQMQEGRGGIQMASAADPILQDEYDKYVFELQEMHPEATPMSLEEFRKQAVAGMADGGIARVGFRYGYGASQEHYEKAQEKQAATSPNRGPAGGASAGGDYGGNVNPEQEYAGRTLEERQAATEDNRFKQYAKNIVNIPPPDDGTWEEKKPTEVADINKDGKVTWWENQKYNRKKRTLAFMQNKQTKLMQAYKDKYNLTDEDLEKLMGKGFDLSYQQLQSMLGDPSSRNLPGDNRYIQNISELLPSKRGSTLPFANLMAIPDITSRITLPSIIGEKIQGPLDFDNFLSGINRLNIQQAMIENPNLSQKDIDNYYNLTMGKGGTNPLTGKTIGPLFPPTGGEGPLEQQDPCKGPNPPAWCTAEPDPDPDPEDPDDDIPVVPPTGTQADNPFQFALSQDAFNRYYPEGMQASGTGWSYDPSTQLMGHQFAADGGRIGYAGGGITDLRQGYFLGNLVKGLLKPFKGIARGIKKFSKSKAGKLALMAFLGHKAGMFGKGTGGLGDLFRNAWTSTKGIGLDQADAGGMGKGWFNKLASKALLSDPTGGWSMGNVSPWKSIGLMSILPLLQGKQDDENEYWKWHQAEKDRWLGEFPDIPYMAQGGRIRYSEGKNGKDDSMVGISMSIEERWKRILEILKQMEDVRSGKTTDPKYDPEDKAMGGRIGYAGGYMVDDEEEDTDYARAIRALSYRPKAQEGGLMDLGGMEKDYRNEGGFVPIGGQERADDVPARLSKNEFVFTADAVRAAGGGDIDAGAEVMENVMENLEQGGQVSEESQGLEGARNMFATAQRLEGVL